MKSNAAQQRMPRPGTSATAEPTTQTPETRERRAQALAESELRYRRLFEAAQEGILILDAETGLIEDVNPYLIDMLGYSREEFLKKKLWEVGAFKDIEASKDAFGALQDKEYIRYEDLPLKAKDGRLIQVEFVSNVYVVGRGKVIQCDIRDITEHKRMEAEISHLALTDDLTGFYNRRGFTLLAEQEVKVANRLKRSMLLVLCDVDHLKVINDSLGHAQGDLALREVSAVLKETFRAADIPARIGGDEFVVLAVDASLESAKNLTNRIEAKLERRNQQSDRLYPLTFSMGIARYDPAAPCTVSELIAQADGLMYQKKLGKNKEQ